MDITDVSRERLSYGRHKTLISDADYCEQIVSNNLINLWGGECYVFNGLILPVNYRTKSSGLKTAQIDHIVVSKYGVFCIETKSHHGYVYGRKNNDQWAYYIADKKYEINNSYKQNRHHSAAINYSLGGLLKDRVWLFVVYPNAKKVMLDGIQRDASIDALIRNLYRHTEVRYSEDEIAAIVRRLKVALPFRNTLSLTHNKSVVRYVEYGKVQSSSNKFVDKELTL
jgi:hypothetical protein